MLKRLVMSFGIIGAMGALMAFGAFAYFKDSVSTGVTITAGTASVQVAADADCNGSADSVFTDVVPGITVSGIVPGDEAQACLFVKNAGDGALDLYVHTAAFAGSAALQSVFQVQVDSHCAYASPNAGTYTTDNSGRGCKVADEVAEGGTVWLVGRAKFVDDGSDQSALQGASYTFDLSVDGYTD